MPAERHPEEFSSPLVLPLGEKETEHNKENHNDQDLHKYENFMEVYGKLELDFSQTGVLIYQAAAWFE